MNQLATMLDTDLTVDPRARAARTGTDAEPGADFGQVLQGISKPGEATIGTEQAGRNSRHSKKGNIESLLNVSADPVVSTMPMARQVATEVLDGRKEALGDSTLVEHRGDSLITSTATGGDATAREVPTTAVEAITSAPASTNATVVNGTPVPGRGRGFCDGDEFRSRLRPGAAYFLVSRRGDDTNDHRDGSAQAGSLSTRRGPRRQWPYEWQSGG